MKAVYVESPLASPESRQQQDESSVTTGATGQGSEPQTAPPSIPILSESEAGEDADALRPVRAFHLGAPTDVQSPESGAMVPALIWPYRDPDRVRTPYPLVLSASTEAAGPLCRPLSAVLAESSAGAARPLRDNLMRIERAVREHLQQTSGPVDARTAFEQACRGLASELGLRGDSADAFERGIEALVDAFVPTSQLIASSAHPEMHLMRHAAGVGGRAQRVAFGARVEWLVARLREVLRVERSKAPEARDAGAVQRSMGPAAGRFVDPGALAEVVGEHRGPQPMDAYRRARIERVQEALEAYLRSDWPEVCLVAEDAALVPEDMAGAGLEVEVSADAVQAASSRFDREVSARMEVFRALRLAQLELHGPAGAYDPDTHRPWLDSLDWRSLDAEELLSLPTVVAVTSDAHLARSGLLTLSRLLSSGRPVRVLVQAQPGRDPAAEVGLGPCMESGARLELGYLGIAHREAFVWQSSTAAPEHLERGMKRGFEVNRASLFVVALGPKERDKSALIGGHMHAAAAIEGRTYPLFGFDPGAGSSWARRFDLSGNPSIDDDWSTERLECNTDQGESTAIESAFTSADFALLEPRLARCFCVVPRSCARHQSLTPLADYLALGSEDAASRIPFVWAVDRASAKLSRLVLSRHMAAACRDRLGFWKTLQELAGVRNEYVSRAIVEAHEEARADARKQVEELSRAHAAELATVRRDTAAQAMQRLAEALVGVDVGALSAVAATRACDDVAQQRAAASAQPEPAAVGEQDQPDQTEPEPGEDVESEEPWIEAALCTSCNDCMGINAQLFVYDENKQAQIADPRAGSYAQLVAAAEKCPARCIHPGTPLNPDEPDLEALVARAKPFN